MFDNIINFVKDLMAGLSASRVSRLAVYNELKSSHEDWTRATLKKETEKEYQTQLSFLKADDEAKKAELSEKWQKVRRVMTNKYVISTFIVLVMVALATIAGLMIAGLVLFALAFLVALGIISIKVIYGLCIVMLVGMMIYSAVEAIKMLQKSADWLHKV